MTKTGRNDPCPCGSGKKYKKCCELKEPRKLTAHKIEGEGLSKSASSISGLFQKISHIPPVRLKEAEPLLEEKQEEVKEEPPAQGSTENP